MSFIKIKEILFIEKPDGQIGLEFVLDEENELKLKRAREEREREKKEE